MNRPDALTEEYSTIETHLQQNRTHLREEIAEMAERAQMVMSDKSNEWRGQRPVLAATHCTSVLLARASNMATFLIGGAIGVRPDGPNRPRDCSKTEREAAKNVTELPRENSSCIK